MSGGAACVLAGQPAGSVAAEVSGVDVWQFDAVANLAAVFAVPKAQFLGAVTNAEGTDVVQGMDEARNVKLWPLALFKCFESARKEGSVLLPPGALLSPVLSGPRVNAGRQDASEMDTAGGAWVVRAGTGLDVSLILTCGFSKIGAAVTCCGAVRLSFTFADAAAAAAGHRDTVPVHVCSYAPKQQGSGSNVPRPPQPCVHEQGAAGACHGRAAGAGALTAANAASLTGYQRRAAGAAATTGASSAHAFSF
jgi:hypothetical protein